jgi:hypothetical protein
MKEGAVMTQRRRNRWRGLAAAAAVTVLLAACGGGGGRDDDPPPPPDPLTGAPESANQSSAGLVAYLWMLVNTKSETAEPFALDGFNPMRPDNTEPEPVF